MINIKRLIPIFFVFVIVSLSLIIFIKSNSGQGIKINEQFKAAILPSLKFSPGSSVSDDTIESAISLEKIFDGIDPGPNESGNWSLLVGGDVMIGRTVNYKTLTYSDFDWPYENLAELFKSSDLSFVNLESPVVESCPTRNDGMIFCGNVGHIEAMAKAGIDVVSLANNHMLNHGTNGLETTLSYLLKNNITAVGTANPTYVSVKNHKIAFLAYTDIECYPGVECVDVEKIKKDISNAESNSDLVIVMYHWGAEYRDYPTGRQKEIAHLSIDSGADLVLGNHPHWIQPFEIYKEKLIMYSHGNLVFDQMWSQKTREGVLVEYVFNGSNLVDAKIHPILIEDYGRPSLLQGKSKTDKLEFIKRISENLAKGTF